MHYLPFSKANFFMTLAMSKFNQKVSTMTILLNSSTSERLIKIKEQDVTHTSSTFRKSFRGSFKLNEILGLLELYI